MSTPAQDGRLSLRSSAERGGGRFVVSPIAAAFRCKPLEID